MARKLHFLMLICGNTRIKESKAIGSEQIHGEILKVLGNKQLKLLTNLFIEFMSSDTKILANFQIYTSSKKEKRHRCKDHRIISLMSYTLKSFSQYSSCAYI